MQCVFKFCSASLCIILFFIFTKINACFTMPVSRLICRTISSLRLNGLGNERRNTAQRLIAERLIAERFKVKRTTTIEKIRPRLNNFWRHVKKYARESLLAPCSGGCRQGCRFSRSSRVFARTRSRSALCSPGKFRFPVGSFLFSVSCDNVDWITLE